jgi:hypothetical protein
MKTKEIGNAPDLAAFLPRNVRDKATGEWMVRSLWSNPETFASYIKSLHASDAWCDAGWGRGSGDEAFRGTKTMTQALMLAREGWQEGATKVQSLVDRINVAHPMQRRAVRYDVAGAFPCVPRAVAGDPMHMRRLDTVRSRKRPVLTLVSDMSVAAMIEASSLVNRAAVVAAIIDRIENAGFSVEVLALAQTSNYSGQPSVQVGVRLKDAGQPLDLPRLAYGVGHPSMYRRLAFAQWGHEHCLSELGHGLGHAYPSKPDAFDGCYLLLAPDDEHFQTEKRALDKGLPYLMASLREQGCPAV